MGAHVHKRHIAYIKAVHVYAHENRKISNLDNFKLRRFHQMPDKPTTNSS